LTSVPFTFNGKIYNTGKDKNWKTTLEGMNRLAQSERIEASSDSLNYVRFLNDFPVFELTTLWDDIGGIQSRADPKIYVVQTSNKDRRALPPHDHRSRGPRPRSNMRERNDSVCLGAVGATLDYLRFKPGSLGLGKAPHNDSEVRFLSSPGIN